VIRGSHFVLAVCALVALAAAGAPATAAPAALPVAAVESFDVQVWPGGAPGQIVAIVGASIAEDTPRPALVRVPVPEGAEIVWAGELTGATSASDTFVEPRMLETEYGRVAEVTVTVSSEVQVECIAGPIESTGAGSKARLTWIQSVPSTYTAVSMRLPAGVTSVEMQPEPVGTPQVNDAGEQLYSAAPLSLAVGEELPITAAYGSGSAAATPDGQAVTPLLIGLVVAVALAGALLIWRLRHASGTAT